MYYLILKHMCLLQMKHKESTEAGGGVFAPTKPIKEGLVSQIASKFQNNETVVLRKKSSVTEPVSLKEPLKTPKTSVASVSRTESHQARFNSARAMFEKMGSADDLDSISSSNGNNRGSRASSVQRSRSTSPFNTVKSVQPPRSPETPETVSFN